MLEIDTVVTVMLRIDATIVVALRINAAITVTLEVVPFGGVNGGKLYFFQSSIFLLRV